MLGSFFWGFIAASSLLVGAMISYVFPIGKKTLGMIMGFGAGVLLSAVSFELVMEAAGLAKLTGMPGAGFFAGAATFFFSDLLISKMGGASSEGSPGRSNAAALAVPMILAIILDGIPESVSIGVGIQAGGSLSIAMLVAVFISNIPEAVASTTGMRAGGWGIGKISLLWLVISLVCGVASLAGFAIFANLSDGWMAFVLCFAGGAILMMLANTMMPEAFESGGRLAGVFTVLGFGVAVWIVVLERSGIV